MEDKNYYGYSDSQTEEKSSFDILRWIYKVLRYWYVILICVALALGAALYKNRSWMPSYKSAAKLVLEEYKSMGAGPEAVMNGFGLQSGFTNVSNQLVMLTSYDLIGRVVDQIPLRIDMYNRGHFRTTNLYGKEFVSIDLQDLQDQIYYKELSVKGINEKNYEIAFEGDEDMDAFSVKGVYGEPLTHSYFTINVMPAKNYQPHFDHYLRFLPREYLIADYSSRLGFNFVMKESSVIEVSLIGYSPERDVAFINTLTESFLKDNVDRKNQTALRTINFIEEQLAIISDSLNVAENRLRGFQKDNNVIDADNSSYLFGYFRTLDQEKAALTLKGKYLSYLDTYLEGNINEEALIAPTSMGITDPGLMNLVNTYSELVLKKSDLGVKSPLYAKTVSQINVTKEALKELLHNMKSVFSIEQKELDMRYEQVMSQVKAIPEKEKQMLQYQRNFKVNDTYYTFLLQKRAESQIQQASNMPDNVILENARILSITNTKDKLTTLMIFLFLGFFLPIVAIIIKELMDQTFQDIQSVESISQFPILGTITHTDKIGVIIAPRYPKSRFTEALRSIRSRIEYVAQRESPICVTLTSAEPADGKTFVACNLAATYKMTGKRVILVDLDLRKPAVSESLGLDRHEGITNWLIGKSALSDLIITDAKAKFDILPAGTLAPNPGELIRSPKIKELIIQLKQNYDYIVIDCSPYGLVNDIVAIAPLAEANLFVVRMHKTNRRFARQVLEQAEKDNIAGLNVIINDLDSKKTGYGSGYGYGYGYGYGERESKRKTQYYNDYYEENLEHNG